MTPHASQKNQGPVYRLGPDLFDTDAARLDRALARYDQGKGLIGGDPRKRRRWLHPLPAEPAPAYRLHESSPEHLERLHQFLGSALLEIEIGSGPGDFIVGWAQRHPDRHFLSFEVKWKLVRDMVERAQRLGIENLWVSDDDARHDLPRILSPASVDVFHILFPDPWWKPRHQPRRLFVPPFMDALALLLRPGGVLRAATDVPGYGDHMLELLSAHPAFAPAPSAVAARFADAPPTSRQTFCDKIGRPYRFFYFERVQRTPPIEKPT